MFEEMVHDCFARQGPYPTSTYSLLKLPNISTTSTTLSNTSTSPLLSNLGSLELKAKYNKCKEKVTDKFRLVVDVIQFELAVERAMRHACGNALVWDTMEVAMFVTWEKGQEFKG